MNAKNQHSAEDKLARGLPVSRRVQIIDVELIETSAHRRLTRGSLPDQLEISVDPHVSVEDESRNILVDVDFRLDARYADENAPQEPLQIRAVFRLTYRADSLEGLHNENYSAFGETNGVYSAWPYWREYVQSVTGRMGLPGLVIPVFRLGTGGKASAATGAGNPERSQSSTRRKKRDAPTP